MLTFVRTLREMLGEMKRSLLKGLESGQVFIACHSVLKTKLGTWVTGQYRKCLLSPGKRTLILVLVLVLALSPCRVLGQNH